MQQNNKAVLQCVTTTHSPKTKSNTCYTAGIIHARAGDTIHVADHGSNRYSLFDASKSFFGLVKLGDAHELQAELI